MNVLPCLPWSKYLVAFPITFPDCNKVEDRRGIYPNIPKTTLRYDNTTSTRRDTLKYGAHFGAHAQIDDIVPSFLRKRSRYWSGSWLLISTS